eukprot:TRINITY_DN12457_c0_g1_i2.p1 TRINITY_DN12457_c0_g1~~TRINITY_DN12457_c0_g1_i2.p1  ORF type:complete len:438 (+),score=138.97 TRINITY_DN12457_c0_g1_i2:34-1314(+)
MLAILVAALAGLVAIAYLFLRPHTAFAGGGGAKGAHTREAPSDAPAGAAAESAAAETKDKRHKRPKGGGNKGGHKPKAAAAPHKAKVIPPPPHPLLLRELKGHSEAVTSVAFSPDGRFLATSSEDGSIRLIQAATLSDAEPKTHRIPLSFDHATALAFNDNTKRLAAVTSDYRKCCLFSIPSEAEMKKGIKPTLMKEFETGHSNPIMEVMLLDVEKWMVVVTCGAASDTIINLFSVKGEKLTHADTGHIKNNVACASADNRFIAVGCYLPEVTLLEVCRKKQTGEFDKLSRAMTLGGHKGQVVGVAINSTTTRAATVSLDGTWRVWDITVRYNLDEDPRCQGTYPLDATKGVPTGIAFGPGGKVVAISADKRLLYFSAETGAQVGEVADACGTGSIVGLKSPRDAHCVAVVTSGNKHAFLWKFPEV